MAFKSKEELADAKVYVGFDALNFGLIDALGTKEEAIKKASKLAGITNYEVMELNEEPVVKITISLSVDQSILKSVHREKLNQILRDRNQSVSYPELQGPNPL